MSCLYVNQQSVHRVVFTSTIITHLVEKPWSTEAALTDKDLGILIGFSRITAK